MAVDIGAVLSGAWQTVVKNRILWLLGFIVALLEFSTNNSNYRFSENDKVQIFSYNVTPGAELAVLIITLAIVLAIVFLLLRSLFDAALIAAGDRSAKNEHTSFREAWQEGKSGMWKVLVFNLIFAALILLVVIGVIAILGVTGFGVVASALSFGGADQQVSGWGVAAIVGWALFALVALMVVAVPLIIAFGVTTQVAQRAALLNRQTIGQAWSTGWSILMHNKLNVTGVLVVQMLVNIVVGAVTAALLFPLVAVPVISLGTSPNLNDPLLVTGAVALIICAWLASSVVLALPKAWNSLVWTLFYRAATVGLLGREGRERSYGGQIPPTVPGGYSR